MTLYIPWTVLGLSVLGMIYCKYAIYRCNVRIKRNQAVYDFRNNLLHDHPDLFDRLPEYESMIYDGKPLVIESYFPELNTKFK